MSYSNGHSVIEAAEEVYEDDTLDESIPAYINKVISYPTASPAYQAYLIVTNKPQ